MFEKPFSFEGRIRRTEYGLSILFYSIAYVFISLFIESSGDEALVFLLIFLIPALWFIWAQGAKRCHDIGNSGWYQLIPFYSLFMMERLAPMSMVKTQKKLEGRLKTLVTNKIRVAVKKPTQLQPMAIKADILEATIALLQIQQINS